MVITESSRPSETPLDTQRNGMISRPLRGGSLILEDAKDTIILNYSSGSVSYDLRRLTSSLLDGTREGSELPSLTLTLKDGSGVLSIVTAQGIRQPNVAVSSNSIILNSQ